MADISAVAGEGSSSVHVRADGKDRVKLDAQMFHSLQRGDRALGLRVNVSQSLLPSSTDLHLNMAANISSDRYIHLYINTCWDVFVYHLVLDSHTFNRQC